MPAFLSVGSDPSVVGIANLFAVGGRGGLLWRLRLGERVRRVRCTQSHQIAALLAGLSAGRWFLLAAPDVCPVIGLLQLEGSRLPIRVEQLNYIFESDVLPIRITADLGCTWLRRTGVVKGGV